MPSLKHLVSWILAVALITLPTVAVGQGGPPTITEDWSGPSGSSWPSQWTVDAAGNEVTIQGDAGEIRQGSPRDVARTTTALINTATFTDSVQEVDITGITWSAYLGGGLMARVDGDSFYYASVHKTTGGGSFNLRLHKSINGSSTALATQVPVGETDAVLTGHLAFTVETVGSDAVLTATFTDAQNVVTTISATDSSPLPGDGQVGLRGHTHSATNRVVCFDNYTATDLQAGITEDWAGSDGDPWPSQWTIDSPAPVASIQGEAGNIQQVYSTNPQTVLTLINTATFTDSVQTVDMMVHDTAFMGGGLIANYSTGAGGESYYWARVRKPTAGGGFILQILKTVDGNQTALAGGSPYEVVVSDAQYGRMSFSVQMVGSTAELQLIYTDYNDTVTALAATDASPLAGDGQVGMRSLLSSNSARFVRYDNYSVASADTGPAPGPTEQDEPAEDNWDGNDGDPVPAQWTVDAGGNDVGIQDNSLEVRHAGSGAHTTKLLLNTSLFTNPIQDVDVKLHLSAGMAAGLLARVDDDTYYQARLHTYSVGSGVYGYRVSVEKVVDGASPIHLASETVTASESLNAHMSFSVRTVGDDAQLDLSYIDPYGSITTLTATDSSPLAAPGQVGLIATTDTDSQRFARFDNYRVRPAGPPLAGGGVALQSVVVAPGASAATQDMAQTLADYLSEISGATFQVTTGDGSDGIAVGVAGDFPTLGLDTLFDPVDTLRQEEYLLRSHAEGVYVIGATERAVEYAVWDLLYRLGHRQFFPGDTWEVIPDNPSLSISVDAFEAPDFKMRRIWYGFGTWEYNSASYGEWSRRNRTLTTFWLTTSHSYDHIMNRNQAAFDAHPEYLALIDGVRQGNKFCISNPDLRQLVIQDRLNYLQENPNEDSVSTDPSDGGNWCEGPLCAAMGSVTDRVVLLTNEVAAAVAQTYPGKYVGVLAYNEHSPPPTIQVHPNVIVKVQTSFITGGYTFDELMTGWQAKGATTGVGDYYSIFQSHKSRPALQKGADLVRVRTTIPKFYDQGARIFSVESADAWGAIGLSHYLASRLLWDVSEADQYDALLDDFFSKAFGPAKAPMEGFFDLIYIMDEEDMHPLIRRDMLARMYRFLDEARTLAVGHPEVNARIDHLILFTRYEELFQQYAAASGQARQDGIEAVMRHGWRIKETSMVHSKPIVNNFSRFGDSTVVEPDPVDVQVNMPFTAQELDDILANGIANTEVVELGFDLVSFSRELVPAAPLNLPVVTRGGYNDLAPTGTQRFYTWFDSPGDLTLRISSGHVEHQQHLAANVQTTLYAEANPLVGDPVDYDESVPPDLIERTVVLSTPFVGLHEVNVWPTQNRAKVWSDNVNVHWTMETSLDNNIDYNRYWNLYFYVPKGTTVVGGFADWGRGTVRDGSGNTVFDFIDDMNTPDYFSIPVPPGEDGKLWKFHQVIGQRILLTVPPYLARSEKELLLPREVVEADAP